MVYCKGEACAGGNKVAHYGVKGSRKKQWCAGCAKDQEGETERIHKHKLCEGCGKKRPHYGLTDTRKPQWCAGCAEGLV